MNDTTMAPELSSAIERELSAIGTRSSRLQRQQRRSRALATSLAAIGVAGAITGAAVVINALPGETTTTPIGSVTTATGTGPGTIELGTPPDGATDVIIDLDCDQGSATVPAGRGGLDSVTIDCDFARDASVHIKNGALPESGTTYVRITADPGTTWTASAQYAIATSTEWAVNEHGETYGVDNENGVPDLTPALTADDRVGWMRVADIWTDDYPDGAYPVYEVDGRTLIGHMRVAEYSFERE